jgi:hypothetical protein
MAFWSRKELTIKEKFENLISPIVFGSLKRDILADVKTMDEFSQLENADTDKLHLVIHEDSNIIALETIYNATTGIAHSSNDAKAEVKALNKELYALASLIRASYLRNKKRDKKNLLGIEAKVRSTLQNIEDRWHELLVHLH